MANSTIYIRAGNGEKGQGHKGHKYTTKTAKTTCSWSALQGPLRNVVNTEVLKEYIQKYGDFDDLWMPWKAALAVVHSEVMWHMWPYTQVFNYFNWIVPFHHFLMIFPELSRLSWSLALWRQQISDRLALWLSKIRQQHSTLLTGLRTKFQMRP